MIKQRKLGPYSVSTIGMGCMPLSFPLERDPSLINEPDRAIAVIHAALDAGITLLETFMPYPDTYRLLITVGLGFTYEQKSCDKFI
jgi:aryl-alcohol dehydrogenase-like predicted oxidoreductase